MLNCLSVEFLENEKTIILISKYQEPLEIDPELFGHCVLTLCYCHKNQQFDCKLIEKGVLFQEHTMQILTFKITNQKEDLIPKKDQI